MPDYSEVGGSRASFATMGVASVQVLSVNNLRKEAIICNDSDTVMYILKGDDDAIVGSGIRLNAGGGTLVIEPDENGYIWRGAVQGISTAGTKNLSFTEDW